MTRRNFCVSCFIILEGAFFAYRKPPPPPECTDATGCVDIEPDKALKLAVLQALSGSAANIGIEQAQSIELAIARRDNQLLGHPIEVQIKDERCSPKGGAIAALTVVADSSVVRLDNPATGAEALQSNVIYTYTSGQE